jgi:translocation and assembly module TamB
MLPQGSGLLAGALSTVVSSRVEKFFGKSRIKIDPQMTGVENIPQARLSIEQSLSRDVTLTIMTNLARTQQQVVRLEWDLSREWQLIVVRDENGVFGADILYRKRFR